MSSDEIPNPFTHDAFTFSDREWMWRKSFHRTDAHSDSYAYLDTAASYADCHTGTRMRGWGCP